ncbi:MAG: cation:proton antiporter [Candidatus Omnitrophica bacterium]|nr:cation:proton antiporter [Candidatus Omnitrophota bacterium]
MFEHLAYIFTKISIPHLNVLFLLGLALFGGTVGGRLFQKLRIPQVVGYIAIGVVIGESGLKIVDHDIILSLQPLSYFALGLIGFMIGGELKKEIIAKYGKQFLNILLYEGLTAFLVVSVLVGVVGTFLFGNWRISWALGLLLGAIASATAPAATTEVLREYKTRGPLTRTVLGIVALDDGLALILFAIAASIAGSLIGNGHNGILRSFIYPLYEIFGSIIIGISGGFVLSMLLKKYSEEERLLAFSIGTVLLISGLAIAINVDMLLAAMSLGVIVTNFTPRKSRDIFKVVGGFSPPIYVLFFVLVGAKLDIRYMTLPIVLLGCVYLIGRTSGKTIGARLGARISKVPKSVQKYLPLCLLSQAGVAIGLSILASHYFPGEIGNTIVIIITATAFILELIGPTFVKIAMTKAGEVGLNITEDDIIQSKKADDFMDKNPPLIYENMQITDILRIFSENDNLYYPLINRNKELQGIITVEGIKQTFLETDIGGLILAHDLMQPVVAKISKDVSLFDVRKILNNYNLDCLPVVDEKNRIEGFIERKSLNRFISTKIIELQRQADSLELAM